MPETDSDDDLLDGCELDFTEDPTDDMTVELMPLFADALDPDTPKTVEEAKGEWEELFGGVQG
jgi:hypothetical protein